MWSEVSVFYNRFDAHHVADDAISSKIDTDRYTKRYVLFNIYTGNRYGLKTDTDRYG